MNRKARRALTRREAKKFQAQLPKGAQPELDPQTLMRQAALSDYQAAAAYQKLVTEVLNAVEETIPYAPEDGEAHAELQDDKQMLLDMVLEARRHTIECGLAFAEAVCPMPVPTPAKSPGLPYMDDGEMQGTPEQLAMLGIDDSIQPPHAAEEPLAQ
jgi:hypothetical protein